MLIRFFSFLFLAATLPVCSSIAQTVRLETSLGSIDIELFPNEAPLTVANFLAYVTSGRYDNTVIHRAVIDNRIGNSTVVQMGKFLSTTTGLPPDRSGFIDILEDPQVPAEPANTTGLSHIAGTVGLARSITNSNTGTSSFFVNGDDNSFLDPTFAVFGRVTDLNTIDGIFATPQFDGSALYGGGPTFSNIPLQTNDDMVFINSARVIPEPASVCLVWGAAVVMISLQRMCRS